MSCFIKVAGKEYTKEDFEKALSNPSFVKQLEAEYSNSQEEYQSAAKQIGQFSKYVEFKESLVGQIENKLSKIRNARKTTKDKTKLKELIKLEHELEFRLNGNDKIKGLNQEIDTLKRNKDINAIGYYAEKDIERLKSLSESTNPDDLKEARKIINFYKAAGTFEATSEHPIFTTSEIFNEDGTYNLGDIVRFKFEDWKNQVLDEENKIIINEKRFIEETVNSNPQIKKMYEKLSYTDLNKPIEDTSWVDMMIMDISNGIFSKNGILPQIMLDVTQRGFEKQMVMVKEFESQINKLTPDVEKQLTSMGYTLPSRGIIGIRGVSYDLFKQLSNDKPTGSIAIRYSQHFYDKLAEFNKSFYSSLNFARDKQDPEKIVEVFKSRNNWYRKNTLMIDISRIPEITNGAEPNNDHVKELKSILGEQGYKEEVEKQKELFDKWNIDFEVWKEMYLEERGITKDQLTDDNNLEINIYERENSPLYGIKNYFDPTSTVDGNYIVNSSFKYNVAVPRRIQANVLESNGTLEFKDSKTATDFYDSNFETIESNKTLKDFHTLIIKQAELIRSMLPAEAQKKLRINSLPSVRKSITEILLDKNIGIFKAMSLAAKELYDRIKAGFGVNVQSSFSNAAIDVATGKPDYKINDAFLGNNKEQIQEIFDVETVRFIQAFGKNRSLDKRTSIDINKLSPASITLLAEYLDIPPTKDALLKKEGKYIPVGRIIKDFATHKVVEQQSFDLPKIMKYYSAMAAEYIARNELLPMVEVMKKHYTEIKKTSTNNVKEAITLSKTKETATEGLRTNAIKQVDDWFNRVVLNNYGTKEEGVIRKLTNYTGTGEGLKERGKEFFSDLTSGRILSVKDKAFRREINKLIANETNAENIERLEEIRDNLGKKFAMSAFFNSILNYTRFLGLGYNVSSSITNFIEGQASNLIIASSGDYFKPDDYFRALDIVKGSFLKTFSLGKIQTQGSQKARALMDRYRIIQDSTNELQKASSKSAISGLEKYAPYELTRRVEYVNQTPLMIAIALNTEIEDKNNIKSNLWDAMNPDGTLKEEFRTPENIANWENTNGDSYNDFKIKVGKAIDTAHGNYEQLRGMMAKSSLLGKAVLMFKSWIGRAAYTRFAKGQDDVQAGVKDYKGRYWSHTKTSGAIQGTLIGLAGAGIVGSGIGAVAGFALGAFYGTKTNESIGMIREMIFNVKALFRKSLGNPINVIAGKNLIDTHPNMDEFIGDKFTQRDAVNMQANLSDMSLLLGWLALSLMVKMAFWDEEDKEGDTKRMLHNSLINRLMQLTSQNAMFLNPSELYANTVGDLSVLGFLDNVSKTLVEVNDALQGFDTIPTGTNAGESALYNQVQKTFFPSVVRDFPSMGFEKQAERQFAPSVFDSWFMSEEKSREKILKGQRATRRKQLKELFESENEDGEISEEVIEKRANKIVNRELPLD